MANLVTSLNPRVLKQKWQEYLKPTSSEAKETKLGELLSLLVDYKRNSEASSLQLDNELSSIANLLGCELLRVIHHQCEILDHDSDLVQYFQRGLGLYLLQALHTLADQVNSCNSEVSNVLSSIIPCFLSVPCELEDAKAFTLLKDLCLLYNDISNGRKTAKDPYSISMCYNVVTTTQTQSTRITLLQELTLFVDIISRLSLKSCSLAVAESSLNVAEKLATILLEFSRDPNESRKANVETIEDIPECNWASHVRLLCICVLQCALWKLCICTGGLNASSHRVDQSELVKKLLLVLRTIKSGIWQDSWLRPSKDGDSMEHTGYRLFLVYSVLGFIVALLRKNVCSEMASVSELDLARKVYSREQVQDFVEIAPELFQFVCSSLNAILTLNISPECGALLKEKAVDIISLTGHLMSVVKKATASFEAELAKLKTPTELSSIEGSVHGESSIPKYRFSLSLVNEVESSSGSEGRPANEENQEHSTEDCAVSALCCALLKVYETTTVQDIDVACLNALSRCGICHCMNASVTVLPLMSRFIERLSQLQDMALALLCKILLKHKGSATQSFTELDLDSDQVLEESDDVPGCSPTSHDTSTTDNWSCMDQLFALAMGHDGELTLRILRHLKMLAKFGSPNLREALLTKIVLPFVLKFNQAQQKRKSTTLTHLGSSTALRKANDSGYTSLTDRDTSESEGSVDTPRTVKATSSSLPDEGLNLSLSTLLVLLGTQRLRRLFLDSNGLSTLVSFLTNYDLHSICLSILELLATQEDGVQANKQRWQSEECTTQNTLASKEQQIQECIQNRQASKRESQDSTQNTEVSEQEQDYMPNTQDRELQSPSCTPLFDQGDPVVTKVLLCSMFLVDITEKSPHDLDPKALCPHEFAANVRFALKSDQVSLLCRIWRTCLRLLRRNVVFRELFVQANGPSLLVVALQIIKECLYRVYKDTTVEGERDKEHAVGCIRFMEQAVAVGLEFENHLVDGVQLDIQIHEAVRVIQRLIQQKRSLRRLIGKAFCTSLLNLAVGSTTVEESPCSKAESSAIDSEKLMFDLADSDDTENDSDICEIECSKIMRATRDVEPGYEADVEQGNRSSDASSSIGACAVRREVMDVLVARRYADVTQGHIRCPEMCAQLVHLLEYKEDMTTDDRSLVLFALEGIAALASFSIRNRHILCEQGILSLILKTFAPFLAAVDTKAKAIQKAILDLVVLLGAYQFTCEDLKIYLNLFNTEDSKKVDWAPLIKTLRTISSLSTFTHGPTYAHFFPIKMTSETFDENHQKDAASSPGLSSSPPKPSIPNASPYSNKRQTTSKQYTRTRSRERVARRSHSSSSHSSSLDMDTLPSVWVIHALHLKPNQALPWPVGSFSLAFWLYLDTGSTSRVDYTQKSSRRKLYPTRDTHARYTRGQKALSRCRHVVSFGTKTSLFEVWVNAAKTALICRWSSSENEMCSTAGHETFVKFSLKDYVWYHLVLSVRAGDGDPGTVTLIVNGSCETSKILPYPGGAVKKHDQVSLLVGEIAVAKMNDNVRTNAREKFQPDPFYRLGNVALFIGDLHRDGSSSSGFMSLLNSSPKNQERLKTLGQLEASFLYLLGPNCQALDYHTSENTVECTSNHFDLKILGDLGQDCSQTFISGPHGEPVFIDEQQWSDVKVSLKKQFLLVYSPVNPSTFLEYKLEGADWTGSASTGKVTHPSPSSVSRRERLMESVHDIGGIAAFLYLFAKTVEATSDERSQTDALSIIFNLAKDSIVYAKELEGLLANKMILKVLLTPKCTPGLHFIKVFFSAACEGELFRETGLYDKPYLVNLNTKAFVKNYETLRDFLLNWRIWYRGGSSVAWETVLLALEALTSSANPHAEFNMRQMERADALGALLLGCQEIQAEDFEFSPALSSQHLNIVENLLGCSGNPRVLKRICDFLVAVHPPHETVLIHVPGNLYLSPIAKLKDRDSTADVEVDGSLSPSVSGECVMDDEPEANQDENDDNLTEVYLPADHQTKPLDTDFESILNETVVEADGTEHLEIARVLNMQDSKNMIISVEHVRESKDKESADLAFPLPTPEITTPPAFEYPKSPSSVDVPGDLSSPLMRESSIKTSSQDPRRHSAPITISTTNTAYQPTESIAGSYDVVSSSELHTKSSQSFQASSSTDEYLVVNSNPTGYCSTLSTYRHYRKTAPEHREQKKLEQLRIGLLEIISNTLVTLADTAVDDVLGEVLKIEYFLCFVNHTAARIRTLSVQIINRILERASLNVINSFHQIYGYHLLAVQIHLHPVTQELAEICLLLFFRQPVSINQPQFLESIKAGSEVAKKINTQAVVPLLGMLEGATFCPEIFQFLTQCLVRTLSALEDFILQATDHGLLVTLTNAVRALAVRRLNDSDKRGDEHTSSVQIVLDNLQYLVMAIVYRSLRMCGDRYFQIFDDLMLFLDRLQYSEPRNRTLTVELVLCSRFLQLCALRFALEYFEYAQRSTKLNRRTFKKALRLSFKVTTDKLDLSDRPHDSSITYWATLDPSSFPAVWQTSKFTSLPADATPTEVTNRFQEVCKKAVSFICFSDPSPITSNGLNLSYSQLTLLPPFEMYKQQDSSLLGNAFETFTQWTFCFLLEILDFCLNKGSQVWVNKWHELINNSKDMIRQQLCRLFIHLMAPGQKSCQKYFALQLTKLSRGNAIFLNLVLGAIATKQKERAVAYVRAFLRGTGASDTSQVNELRNTVEEFLKDVEVQKLDKSGSDDWNEKQLEWERQDRNNKIQWQSKTDMEQKRANLELRQLCQRMMSVAMEVTKVSIDVQDKQRQNLLKHVKTALSNDIQSQKLWQNVIKQLTHERAIWHDRLFFPTSWQLDPTEGPCRVRCRLQRCRLDISDKFILSEHRKPRPTAPPLSYLFEENNGDASSKHIYHIFNSTDCIRFLHRCKSIMPARKIQGEILIGENRVYFVGEETIAELNNSQFFLDDDDVTSISWLFQEIREIIRRRYALHDNALEIFLTNGRTFLLAFETTEDRETVYKELVSNELPNLITTTENLADLTQRWQNGDVTNFAYLTELNKQACRSFNDLMQYPVFPLVLAEYTSHILDLTNRSVFRDLSKPVAVQNPSKVTKFQGLYKDLQDQYDISKKIDPIDCIPPYHYGSHYSNSGVVLHFLVRLAPFTKMFLTYQDKQFDVPDRTFHAIETTWNLSTPDVKELIPEFFFLPEFLLNSEGFDFGVRQNGERVMDVLLPSWANHDIRLFVLIHRQALESDIVSSAINHWIDLIFGFKQEGEAAVEAMNVFHPATYVGGIDKNRVVDALQRQAIQTMTDTYGQMPAKLFEDGPHPERRRPSSRTVESSYWSGTFGEKDLAGSQKSNGDRTIVHMQEPPSPVSTVYGVKWGYYVGSPNHPKPVVCWSDSFTPLVSGLVCLPSSHIFLLPAHATHMIVTRARNKTVNITWSAVLTWNHMDNILRIRDFRRGSAPICLMENINLHKVTCCAVSDECRSLWVGSSTGCLCVWPTRHDRANEHGLELLGRRIRLQGHQARIMCIEICEAFSIVVTGSEDGMAIIWDLNRLCYIKSLPDHSAPVSIVAISPISGEIVTICHLGNGSSSELRLWSVNGRFINKIMCTQRINCVQFSRVSEGVSVNAIAAGLVDGTVRLWNTWTLDHMCDIRDDSCQLPVVWLTYSVSCQHLFTLDSSGTVRAWGASDRANYKPRVIDCVH